MRRLNPVEMRILSRAALIAVFTSAGISVAFMLNARGAHAGLLLTILIGGWVLTPFTALALAYAASKRWSVHTRATLYTVMLVFALGSLAIYGADAIKPPVAQRAFVFVMVPPVSCLLMAIIIPIGSLISGRSKIAKS